MRFPYCDNQGGAARPQTNPKASSADGTASPTLREACEADDDVPSTRSRTPRRLGRRRPLSAAAHHLQKW